MGNHDLFPPPSASLFVCCGLSLLLLRQYMGLSDGNTNLNIPHSHLPPWPSSDVQCPMTMSLSPSLLPLVPICDPIVGHVAGWTRPYSRQCRTEATLTGTAGPSVEFELLESVRATGGGVCLITHPFAHLLAHSFIHSIIQSTTHSVGGPGGQGFDARCLSHYYAVESVDVFGISGQANLLAVHAGHAVPHTERHDHSQPRNRNSTQQERPGLEPISGIPMPMLSVTMPCHAPPLLSPR